MYGQRAAGCGLARDAETGEIELGLEVSTALTRWWLASGRLSAGRAWLRPLPGGLTARQAEVLGLRADGLSNKEIAVRLYLSPGTVERHLATIYHKLGVGGRVEATRYALEHELAGR